MLKACITDCNIKTDTLVRNPNSLNRPLLDCLLAALPKIKILIAFFYGVSKFGVKNFRGVRARQGKGIEIGNLEPLTPNKSARRPESLRLVGRPTIVHASPLRLCVTFRGVPSSHDG